MRLLRIPVAGVLALALGVGAAPAGAATPSQRLFTGLLLKDRAVSPAVKRLLRSEGGFVDSGTVFADLNGDRRSDAVVLVNSGGAAGDVALYVFTALGRAKKAGALHAAYRSQSLYRASASVSRGKLVYRSPRYTPGDDVCCPARALDYTLGWVPSSGTFRVTGSRTVGSPRRL